MDVRLCLVLFDRLLEQRTPFTYQGVTVELFKAGEHAPEGVHVTGETAPWDLEKHGWRFVADKERGVPGVGFVAVQDRTAGWVETKTTITVTDLVRDRFRGGVVRISRGKDEDKGIICAYSSEVRDIASGRFRPFSDGIEVSVPLGIRADILGARIRVEVDLDGWAARVHEAERNRDYYIVQFHRNEGILEDCRRSIGDAGRALTRQIQEICKDMQEKGQLAETARQRLQRYRALLQNRLGGPARLWRFSVEEFSRNIEGEPFLVDPESVPNVLRDYRAEVEWGMHNEDPTEDENPLLDEPTQDQDQDQDQDL